MTALHKRTIATLLGVTALLAGCGTDDTPTAPRNASTNDGLGRPIGPTQPRTSATAGGNDARRAARAFLASYLAVSYGRAKPGELRNATPALRDRLDAQAPRVPPGVENRRPRIVALLLASVAAGQIRATATVDDGDVAPYPLSARLQRQRDGRWLTVAVGD